MSDPVETVVETVANSPKFDKEVAAGLALIALASYGTYDLSRKSVRKIQSIRANRKAAKALKEQQTAEPQQS
jgi:hypothetical protein